MTVLSPDVSHLFPTTFYPHYRMPAEWAEHQGTIITWPHRPEIWRGVHAEVGEMFYQLAAELHEVGFVHINVPNLDVLRRILYVLENRIGRADRVVMHLCDSDDVWARDHGPIFVVKRTTAPEHLPGMIMLDWEFNAWGGKFESALDNEIPRNMNGHFCLPRVEPGLVMEGGSLEVNGRGDLITTESVLLADTRNPGHTRQDIERSLRQHLGVERIHWFSRGLAGDDTDGHIDDMARFVSPMTVVMVMPPEGHVDRDAMMENYRRLKEARGYGEKHFDIHFLPVPEPISFQGEHLPASYANFYISNGKVLVPTFGQPKTDDQALGLLRDLMPSHRIVGIDGRALVTQCGNIHCVTQQIPAEPGNVPVPR